MRFLFTSAQLVAHLDWGGFLATAAALVRRGHEVLWASGSQVASAVDASRVPFHPLAETGWRWPPPAPSRPMPGEPADAFARRRARRSLDQWLDPERVALAVNELQEVVDRFRPDVVVSEMFVAAAAICAERAGTPFVVAGWPAHSPPPHLPAGLEDAPARLQTLLDRFQVHGRYFDQEGPPAPCSPYLHISYWSERWFAGVRLLPQTRHVGGRAPQPRPPDPALPPPDDRPWVWITLGTTFVDDPAFFRMATQAAHALGCRPIVSTGSRESSPAWLADAPAETIVRDQIDFASVLPSCAAAMHHGGAGATHALVTHATPQIVVPHAGDQTRQALGVKRTGVGVTIEPRAVTVDGLAGALAQVLPDRSPYRANAERLRDEFAALGGVERAADLLEQLQGETCAGTCRPNTE